MCSHVCLIWHKKRTIIRSNLLLRFDVSPRLSIIPISKSARSPLFAECESRVELPGDLLLSRCSAPLIAGISHRPSLQLLQKSFPEVLMVRPFLPLAVALSLSPPLFLLSGGKSNLWRFSEKVGKKVER